MIDVDFSAMRASGQFEVSSSALARSTRAISTKAAGVRPVSLWKTREKVRSLMPARSAEVRHAEIAGGIGGDLSDELANARCGGGLHVESGAVLGLSARAAHEQDEIARDRERDVGAAIGFDEGEAKIKAGGDAGGGVERRIGD